VPSKLSGTGWRAKPSHIPRRDQQNVIDEGKRAAAEHNRGATVTSFPGALIGRTSPIRFHVQLSDLLEQEISEKGWERGSRRPSEFELCSHFGVSRSTLRQAFGSSRTGECDRTRERARKLRHRVTAEVLLATVSGRPFPGRGRLSRRSPSAPATGSWRSRPTARPIGQTRSSQAPYGGEQMVKVEPGHH
jgi:hypothetical protein